MYLAPSSTNQLTFQLPDESYDDFKFTSRSTSHAKIRLEHQPRKHHHRKNALSSSHTALSQVELDLDLEDGSADSAASYSPENKLKSSSSHRHSHKTYEHRHKKVKSSRKTKEFESFNKTPSQSEAQDEGVNPQQSSSIQTQIGEVEK